MKKNIKTQPEWAKLGNKNGSNMSSTGTKFCCTNIAKHLEKDIINYLYFDEKLKGNQSQKIKELSNKLNISDKRIYFLHSSGVKKLKNKFKSLNNQNLILPTDHVNNQQK